MRKVVIMTSILAGLLALPAGAADTQLPPFERLKSLAGEWQAVLPGYGVIGNTIRLVSNGKAVEETIGTPDDNEISVYMPDGAHILLTHFCAMTPDGHVARLEAASGQPGTLEFRFVGASNLRGTAAPHMRRMLLRFGDNERFSETWTKTENGKDTVFQLDFTRR